MVDKIINTILIVLVIITFYVGVGTLLEIGMIEKSEIKGPPTEENQICYSIEDRVQELETVKNMIKLLFLLGGVIVIKLITPYFKRTK